MIQRVSNTNFGHHVKFPKQTKPDALLAAASRSGLHLKATPVSGKAGVYDIIAKKGSVTGAPLIAKLKAIVASQSSLQGTKI